MDNENQETASDMLHVLDLPQLYTRPSAQELLKTLTLLTSEPPSWEGSDSEGEGLSLGLETKRRRKTTAVKAAPLQINPEGLAAYLTRIIASDLRWIQDEDTKVEIWEAASIRLSERSGRTGMGAISRKFWIPFTKEGDGEDIQLHEPPLTGDNLGFKTWASSYLLAKKLHRLADDRRLFSSSGKAGPHSILELGSGTGLVGLAAAAALGAEVILTDLPEIIENVDRNIESNRDILEQHNGNAFSAILDWTAPSAMMLSPRAVKHAHHKGDSKFDLILAADPLYSPEHPGLLVQTIAFWLSRVESARVVEDFFYKMHAIGLRVYAEGYETGYDDWGGPNGRKAVRCWWTVWGHESLDGSEAHAVEHDEHEKLSTNNDIASQNLSFVLEKPGSVKFEDRPVPEIKDPHDVIVNVQYTGICGSDVHYWSHGRIGDFIVKSPMVLGHESAGLISAVGPAVKSLKVGDRVAMEPGIPCRYCVRCKAGTYNQCPDMRFAATPPYDGTLARFYSLPEDFCYKLPDAVSLEEGALVEPSAVAVHICRMAKVAPGDSVVIFGAGPVGLLCCRVARDVFGAKKVVAVDVNEERLQFALKSAATHIFKADKASPAENAERMKQEVGLGGGADVAIDASGAEVCIQTAIHVVRMGGRFTQAGNGKSEITFPITAVCSKELTVTGSFRYSTGDYQLVVDMIASGKLQVKDLITKRVKFEDAEEAFQSVKDGKAIKCLIAGPK
ncbi:hypothetical protein IWX50DRAFT_671236 [Phyllosticta citricarpa]